MWCGLYLKGLNFEDLKRRVTGFQHAVTLLCEEKKPRNVFFYENTKMIRDAIKPTGFFSSQNNVTAC